MSLKQKGNHLQSEVDYICGKVVNFIYLKIWFKKIIFLLAEGRKIIIF